MLKLLHSDFFHVGAFAMSLSLEAQALLQELVRRIEAGGIRAGHPNTYPGYKQVHDALGLEMRGETVGQSLKHQGLSDLAHWSHDNHHPAISHTAARLRRDAKGIDLLDSGCQVPRPLGKAIASRDALPVGCLCHQPSPTSAKQYSLSDY
jgi:hypothetical protein